jgi:hypothetical protein
LNPYEIAKRKGKIKGLDEAGELYLRAWDGLGDLLERATPEEQRKLILHVIETIVWAPCEDNPRKGCYTIRFFPDAVDDRPDLLVEQWPKVNSGSEGSDPLLTPVRKPGIEAPCSERFRTTSLNFARFFRTRALLTTFTSYSWG